jgi:hypothetical protein
MATGDAGSDGWGSVFWRPGSSCLACTPGVGIARPVLYRTGDMVAGGGRRRPVPLPGPDDPGWRGGHPLPAGADIDLSSAPLGAGGSGGTFDGLLRETDTLAFVVVDEDRVVYERYFNGAGRQQRQTSFSVAKSFLSALVGIAIDASNPIRRDG